MDTIFMATGVVFLLGLAFVLSRAFVGPTLYDRILATNAAGTKTVIFVTLLGFILKRPEFLDISLLYALLNFVATIAVLKVVEHKRIG
jgi:multicomponent Na+:H+ antiporter subunit F